MLFPRALQPAHLSQLSAEGYHYELWRRNPQTGTKQIIQASFSGLLIDPIETSVQVPNGTWTLSVEPDRGRGDAFGVTLKSAVGLIVALLSAYLAHLLLAQRARHSELELLVSRRTADIKTAKDQLKALLDAIPDPVWLKSLHGRFPDLQLSV